MCSCAHLAVTDCTIATSGTSTVRSVGAMPGSIQSIAGVGEAEDHPITDVIALIVRLTGIIVVSGGFALMK
jgi:hypothetical protein